MPSPYGWLKSKDSLLVILWTGIFLVHALVYLALIPPWQAPDEPTSFELLETMQARSRFVNSNDALPEVQRAIVESMQRNRFWDFGGYGRRLQVGQAPEFYSIWHYRSTQLNAPPLFHLLLVPVDKLTAGWSIEHRLRLMRLLTILIAALAVAVVARIACELRELHPALPLIFPAFVSLSPQFAYMSATVSSDILAALIGTLIFWRLLLVLRDGLTVRLLMELALLAVLGFATKRTTLLVLPAVTFALAWQWKITRKTYSTRHNLNLQLAVSCLALPFLMIALVPNLRDFASKLFQRYVFKGYPNQQLSVLQQLPEQQTTIQAWLIRGVKYLSVTFWGSYGWHEVHIARLIGYLLMAFLGISCLSALIWLARSSRVPQWIVRLGWVAALEVVVMFAMIIFGSPPDFPPQGRYLFPAIAPIFLLTTIGICGWLPRHWARATAAVIVCGLLALNLYCIFGVVVPAYVR